MPSEFSYSQYTWWKCDWYKAMNGFSTHKHTQTHTRLPHILDLLSTRTHLCGSVSVYSCAFVYVWVYCAPWWVCVTTSNVRYIWLFNPLYSTQFIQNLYFMPKCNQINSNCLLNYHKKFNENYLLQICIMRTRLSCGLIPEIS